ncbi:MAG: hypothetical protein JWM53_4602 [bacterium]|nr:hypothetical protein [bacterium]
MLRRFAFALALAAGCASVQRQILQSPAAGGSQWRELTSEHFVVRTDYPEWAAKDALQSFDRSARALIALALPAGARPPRDRLEVIAFEHIEDLQALVDNENLAGQFRFTPDGTRPLLLVSGQGSFLDVFDRTRATMQHEIAHWLLHGAVPASPLWLDEGNARYWESLRLEEGQAIVGSLPQLDLLADWLPAADVMSADAKSFYGPLRYRYYSTAWGIVYVLYTRHADAFARYLSALASGARGEAAWRSAFGSFGARELDAEMHEWFSADRPWAHTLPMALSMRDPKSERAIAPADVHVLWAQLRPRDAKHHDAVAAELATAQRLAPESASVQARLAELEIDRKQYAAALARLELALTNHPGDDDLLRLRGEVLVEEQLALPKPERDFSAVVALTEQLVKENASAPSLRFAARVIASFADKARGVALAERATERAPDCAGCYETLSMTRELGGDLTGAVAAAETALRLLPEGYSDRGITQRLARLRKLVNP